MDINLITGFISFLITLMILSYLMGDNPFFRFATHLFIGVSAGYIAAVAVWQVLWPKLVVPLLGTDRIIQFFMLLPLLGVLLILLKVSPRLSQLGGPAMAYLVGVGAAVAIGGALSGTLFPQALATINRFDLSGGLLPGLSSLFNGGIILIGVVTSLAYFHFGAGTNADGTVRRNVIIEGLAWVGRIFIGITLGAIFAGVYAAALTAFIERISSIINFFGSFSS